MFRISHLKPAGILIKLLANKSITDTGSIFQILVNRLGKKMTKAKLLFAVNFDFFFDNVVLQMFNESDEANCLKHLV